MENLSTAINQLFKKQISQGYKLEHPYPYNDESGHPIYWRPRFEKPSNDHGVKAAKEIRIMSQKPDGIFIASKPEGLTSWKLFNLDKLNADPTSEVYFVEGEQKARLLNARDILATTTGGATSLDADISPLASRTVVIWPDQDEAGEKWATELSGKLIAMNCKVRLVDVGKLSLPPKGDCIEWLKAFAKQYGRKATATDVRALAMVEAKLLTLPEPQPLTIKVKPEPYPIDALPEIIQDAVAEVATFVQAPLPLVASSALTAISITSQALADVQRDEILFGPIGLFLLGIADSGERKTQADKMFAKPIQDYQDEQSEAGKILWATYKANLEAWEAKRGGIKDAIRQRTKGNKSTADLEERLRELEKEKPEPPRVPKLIREDATPEGLAKKLQNEWPSAGVVSNEAGIVFGAHGMSKESIMRNLALLNKLWDGGRYQSDRGDEERSRDVRGARLTMGLMIQEATLRSFFDQSKGLARGSGFLARFLVSWPDSTMGTRFYTPPIEGSPALSKFNQRITEILNQPVPINENGILTPPILVLTTEAKSAWIDFHDAIEIQLSNGGELYDVRDVASKAADNAVRMAALFQLFEGSSSAVGIDAFESASLIVAWHLNEARRFFGELALPVELADAARLDSWLIEYCKREQTHFVGKNHTRQHGPLRNGAALDSAIRELSDLDRAQLSKDQKHLTIKVNPALLLSGGMA